MSGQYMRKYRVLVNSKAAGAAYDVSGLRCAFMIEKAVTDEPGYSQISVYNPAPNLISKVKKGDTVILEAGYETGYYGMIFTGNVIQPRYYKEDSVTSVLMLTCRDGDEYLKSSFTAQTLSKNTSQKDIVNAAISSGGGSVTRGEVAADIGITLSPRGKTLFGNSAEYLRQIGVSNAAQFYVEDGKVNIVKAADYNSSTAVELNPMTGLIGMPEQTDDGVSGQCLINPRIKLNTFIYINSKLITAKEVDAGETKYTNPSSNGVYKIVKLTYEGDTHGDAWYINFEAITQPNKKPTGLTKSKDNPWR